MGLGREVADAYIEVHGDLSDFRRDLEKARGDIEKLAKSNAKSFNELFSDQVTADFQKKWSDMAKAMYNENPLELNRLIKSFDPKDLDVAETKIKQFLLDMSRRHKLVGDDYKNTKKALLDMITVMRKEEELAKAQLAVSEELAEMQEKHNKALEDRASIMAVAIRDNETWARTFEGMTKNNAIAKINEDFKDLTKGVNGSRADMQKFAKQFEGDWAAMRARVIAVTDAMKLQRRITEENAEVARAAVNQYIAGIEDMERAEGAALQRARELREMQERYAASLDGMVNAAHFRRLEDDFRDLSRAMESNDWSGVARGHDSMEALRDRTMEVTREMYAAGRIGDAEFARVRDRLREVESNAALFNIRLGESRDRSREMTANFERSSVFIDLMNRGLLNMGQKLGAMSGLNVITDMMRTGGEFIRNIDTHAVSISKMVTMGGTLVSLIGAGVGGLAVMGQDIAKIGQIAILAPGFLVGAGIGIGVIVAAMKDLKTVLKDLGPQFSALQDSISKNFWEQAEQPIRNLVKNLMPTLEKQLGNTATKMGDLFGEFAKSLQGHASPERVTGMFEKMNRALGTVKKAIDPMVEAFVELGEVGSKYFGRAADAIVDMAEDFNKFIMDASKSGELDIWIEEAIQAFKDLGSIIGSTVGIFNAIGDAAEAAGIGGLSGFADALERADEIMNGERFQTTLILMFEGMKGAAEAVLTAIGDLGPAIEAAMPTFSDALLTVGEIMADIIGFVGLAISNPKLLEGVKVFVDGIKTAVDNLRPAILPLSTSLGGLLELMGQLLPPIASLVSTIIVHLGPIFDRLLQALTPLVVPLQQIVTAFVEGIAPVFRQFVDEVLPPLVDLFVALKPAVDGVLALFTLVAAQLVQGVADAMKDLGPALEKIKEVAGPAADEIGKVLAKMKEYKDFKMPSSSRGGGIGSNPINDLILQFSMALAAENPVAVFIGKFFDKLTADWRRGFGDFLEGAKRVSSPAKIAALFVDFIAGLPGVFFELQRNVEKFFGEAKTNIQNAIKNFFDGLGKDQGGKINPLQDLFKGIPDDIKKGWDDAMAGLEGWWEDAKKGFQEFMSGLLGFDTTFEDDAKVSGGGAGSMSVGAKILPSMLDPEAEQSWLNQLGEDIRIAFEDFFAGIGENLEAWGEDVKTGWDEFWGGFGTIVEEKWTEITTFLDEKYTEIKTGIETWWTEVKTGWDNFWGSLPTKVEEVWTGILVWIDTKIAEIRTNIDNFITTVRTNWDNFWNTVNTKVQTIWVVITTWIQTKINEIKTNFENFIRDVRTNWDNFWNGLSTKVQTIWVTIVTWIATKILEAKTRVDNFIRDVKTNWDNFWRDLPTRVKEGWDNIVREFQTGVDRAVEWVRGLPGRALAAFGEQGGLLRGQGEAIMNGLKAGLDAGYPSVQSMVTSIAGWIAANKGPISYDRLLLVPAGEAIMQGLQTGLRNEMNPLANTLHRITDKLVDTVTEGFAKSRMYAAGADAALGLADGLRDHRAAIEGVMASILPESVSLNGTTVSAAAGGVGTPTPGGVVIEAGAVQITTPTKDPGLVATKTLDAIVEEFSNL